jgi:hypothetical protein
MKQFKLILSIAVLLSFLSFESNAQLLPQAGFQSPALSTSSTTANTDIRIFDPNESGGLLVQSAGDRSGYDYSIAARYLSSGTGTGTNFDGLNSILTPNSDYTYWAGLRSIMNGDGPSDVRAADFRMMVTNGNNYDVNDQIIFAYSASNASNLTGIRLDNNTTGSASKGLWITHDGGDYAVHATGTDKGAYFHGSDIGLNVSGRAVISGSGGSNNRLQVGSGLSRLSIGSAYGSNLNWGTSYVGFNALREGSSWKFTHDGANNGGGAIYGNVGGDIFFTTEQSTGGTDKTLTDQDMSSQVKMVLRGEGQLAIGTNQTPATMGGANIADYRLYVAGGILTEEVRVETGWADYVFEEDYKLPSLESVQAHIHEKGHLMGVPSAREVENDGLELGDITVKQQEKIEELFLYIIELNEAVKELKAENEQLKAAIGQ